MPILRSIPSKKLINGIEVKTSEVALISESNYTTTGEYAIVIKTVDHCDLLLDSKTTDHIVVKALTKVIEIKRSLSVCMILIRLFKQCLAV